MIPSRNNCVPGGEEVKTMKTVMKFVCFVFVVFIALCVQPTRALALELRIRNDFDRRMYAAITYFDGQAQRWRTRGWIAVEPRSERRVTYNSVKIVAQTVPRGAAFTFLALR